MMVTLNRLALIVVLSIALVLPALFLLPLETLLIVLDGIAIAMGSMLVGTYIWGLRNLRTSDAGGYILVLGICIAWTAIMVRLGWFMVWRILDHPDWMDGHWIHPVTVWVIIVGGYMHLTARNAIGGAIPRSNWLLLPGAVLAGIVVALILLGLNYWFNIDYLGVNQ